MGNECRGGKCEIAQAGNFERTKMTYDHDAEVGYHTDLVPVRVVHCHRHASVDALERERTTAASLADKFMKLNVRLGNDIATLHAQRDGLVAALKDFVRNELIGGDLTLDECCDAGFTDSPVWQRVRAALRAVGEEE